MAKWVHSRKGLIIGEVVEESEDTVDIKLENSVVGIANSWLPGEVICVMKKFLTPVEEDTETE